VRANESRFQFATVYCPLATNVNADLLKSEKRFKLNKDDSFAYNQKDTLVFLLFLWI
jgi:hypothetical protein